MIKRKYTSLDQETKNLSIEYNVSYFLSHIKKEEIHESIFSIEDWFKWKRNNKIILAKQKTKTNYDGFKKIITESTKNEESERFTWKRLMYKAINQFHWEFRSWEREIVAEIDVDFTVQKNKERQYFVVVLPPQEERHKNINRIK